jgi:hypothetical protein
MSQQNQVVNKPTAAYWLSLIGGILGLLMIYITHRVRLTGVPNTCRILIYFFDTFALMGLASAFGCS